MQIELGDEASGYAVPAAMPIQLQGVLNDSLWGSFQQKANAVLAEEKERITAVIARLWPCSCIAYVGIASPLFAIPGLLIWPQIAMLCPFTFVLAFCSMCIGICLPCHVASKVSVIRTELDPQLQAATDEVRQMNPNVSLEIKRVNRVVGVSREGRARRLEFLVLHIGVAGALGAGLGAVAPNMMQMPGQGGFQQVEMQQFGNNFGGNGGNYGNSGGDFGNNFGSAPNNFASAPMPGGSPLLGSITCTNCFAQVAAGTAFCSACGNKM